MKPYIRTLITVVLTVSSAFTMTAAKAETTMNEHTGATNKFSCDKLENIDRPFILVLNKGDDLISSITKCARDAKLKGANIGGLGQVQNPVLAYFSSDPNASPTLTTFKGFYELAAVNGNTRIIMASFILICMRYLQTKDFRVLQVM